MPKPKRFAAPPPPTDKTPTEVAAGLAALGLGAEAAGAPAGAGAGAAVSVASAVGTADAIADAALIAALIAAMRRFYRRKEEDDARFIRDTLREQFPGEAESAIYKLVQQEIGFERTFQQKALKRLERDLRDAARVPDQAKRIKRIRSILDREHRYARAREDAMATRSVAAMERDALKRLSPSGAYWRLSKDVKEHTLDCIFMGEKFWPWEVLDIIHPPLHHGCPCSLYGHEEAIGRGFMSPNEPLPEGPDSIRRAKEGIERAHALMESLPPDEIDAYLDELQEAKFYDLRFPKGTTKGGEFRPRRGGIPGVRSIVRKALRNLIPSFQQRGTTTRGQWIKGTFHRIPEGDTFDERIGGHRFHSPPGSLNVYRDGKLVAGPNTEPQHTDVMRPSKTERFYSSTGALAQGIPLDSSPEGQAAVDELLSGKRAHVSITDVRERLNESILNAPIEVGADNSFLTALKGNGFRLISHYSKLGENYTFRHDRSGSHLHVFYDAEEDRVKDVTWTPAALREGIKRREFLERSPETTTEWARDVLGWADFLAHSEDFGVNNAHTATIDETWKDHSGYHDWRGSIGAGESFPGTIEADAEGGRPRSAGADDFHSQEMYAVYQVSAHEASHTVMPPQGESYSQGVEAIEEGLTEEVSHEVALDRLRAHGRDDLLEYAQEHVNGPRRLGTYSQFRSSIDRVLNRAGVDPSRRKELLYDLKYRTPPEKRINTLAAMVYHRENDSSTGWRSLTPEQQRLWIDDVASDFMRGVVSSPDFVPILAGDTKGAGERPRRATLGSFQGEDFEIGVGDHVKTANAGNDGVVTQVATDGNSGAMLRVDLDNAPDQGVYSTLVSNWDVTEVEHRDPPKPEIKMKGEPIEVDGRTFQVGASVEWTAPIMRADKSGTTEITRHAVVTYVGKTPQTGDPLVKAVITDPGSAQELTVGFIGAEDDGTPPEGFRKISELSFQEVGRWGVNPPKPDTSEPLSEGDKVYWGDFNGSEHSGVLEHIVRSDTRWWAQVRDDGTGDLLNLTPDRINSDLVLDPANILEPRNSVGSLATEPMWPHEKLPGAPQPLPPPEPVGQDLPAEALATGPVSASQGRGQITQSEARQLADHLEGVSAGELHMGDVEATLIEPGQRGYQVSGARTWRLSGGIYNADNERVGDFQREVSRDVAYRDRTFIEPAYRGQGFGTAMLEYERSGYRHLGIPEMTSDPNPDAMPFLRSRGFDYPDYPGAARDYGLHALSPNLPEDMVIGDNTLTQEQAEGVRDALRFTWNGWSTDQVAVRRDGNYWIVRGNILKDGKYVGTFRRGLHSKQVFRYRTFIVEEHRGEGFGTELLRREREAYKALDIPVMHVIAGSPSAARHFRARGFDQQSAQRYTISPNAPTFDEVKDAIDKGLHGRPRAEHDLTIDDAERIAAHLEGTEAGGLHIGYVDVQERPMAFPTHTGGFTEDAMVYQISGLIFSGSDEVGEFTREVSRLGAYRDRTYIKEEYRGRGFGTAMLEREAEIYRELDIPEMTSYPVDNAQEFLIAHGFTEVPPESRQGGWMVTRSPHPGFDDVLTAERPPAEQQFLNTKPPATEATLLDDASKPLSYEEWAAQPRTMWHGTPYGVIGGGNAPVHVGTWETAHEALGARVAGQHAPGDVPEVTPDRKQRPVYRHKASGAEGITFMGDKPREGAEDQYELMDPADDPYHMPAGMRPDMIPVRITGPMGPGIRHDFIGDRRPGEVSAESMLKGIIKRGHTPKQGYYYKNESEGVQMRRPDGTVVTGYVPGGEFIYPTSAVVPDASWLQTYDEYTAEWNARHARSASPSMDDKQLAQYGVGLTEVHGIQTSTRVFAAYLGKPSDGFPIGVVTVDPDTDTVEQAFVSGGFRRRGIASMILDYARETTGKSLDRDTGDRTTKGEAFAGATGIAKGESAYATVSEKEIYAQGARLMGALSFDGKPDEDWRKVPGSRFAQYMSATPALSAYDNPMIRDRPMFYDPQGTGSARPTRLPDKDDSHGMGLPMTIQEAPSPLFHVTTAKGDIEFEGMLRPQGPEYDGPGLGSHDVRDYVSFTDDRQKAEQLVADMKLVNMLARSYGHTTAPPQSGRTYNAANFGFQGPRDSWFTTDVVERLKKIAHAEGWEYKPGTITMLEAREGKGYWATDVLSDYFGNRGSQRVGGPKDPYFAGFDVDAFAKIDPNEIGLIEVRKGQAFDSRGLVTYHGGTLPEVRVHGEVPVREGDFLSMNGVSANPDMPTALRDTTPAIQAHRKTVIAIDGPSASAKSTTARKVADKVDGIYLDSGAYYRIAGKARREGRDPTEAILAAQPADLESPDLRTPEIDRAASEAGQDPEIMAAVQERLREVVAASNKTVVIDGRDAGESLNAGTRIYQTADQSERLRRRARMHGATREATEKRLAKRDQGDAAKLKRAKEKGIPLHLEADENTDDQAHKIIKLAGLEVGQANMPDIDLSWVGNGADMVRKLNAGEAPVEVGDPATDLRMLLDRLDFEVVGRRRNKKAGTIRYTLDRRGDRLGVTVKIKDDMKLRQRPGEISGEFLDEIVRVDYRPVGFTVAGEDGDEHISFVSEQDRARHFGSIPMHEDQAFADILGRADELGERYGADVHVVDIATHQELEGYNGTRLWDGHILLGNKVMREINEYRDGVGLEGATDQAREDILAGVYAAYETIEHEAVHGVNPIASEDYQPTIDNPFGKIIEEALTEEVAQQTVHEYLRSHGLDEISEWAKRNPRHIQVLGTYQGYRLKLKELLDEAQVPQADRAELLFRMKFNMNHEGRIHALSHLLIEAGVARNHTSAKNWMRLHFKTATNREHQQRISGFTPILGEQADEPYIDVGGASHRAEHQGTARVGDQVEFISYPPGVREPVTVVSIEQPKLRDNGKIEARAKVRYPSGQERTVNPDSLRMRTGQPDPIVIEPDVLVPAKHPVSKLRFYHGTSSEGEALARERGEIRPLNPEEIATGIAEEFDVDPEKVINDIRFQFSRDRQRDPHVYVTQDMRVAQSYADAGSETINDALAATWSQLNRDRIESEAISGKEASAEVRAFQNAWREKHGVTGHVLAFDLPMSEFEQTPTYRNYVADRHQGHQEAMSPEEYLDVAYPINTLILDKPLSLGYEAQQVPHKAPLDRWEDEGGALPQAPAEFDPDAVLANVSFSKTASIADDAVQEYNGYLPTGRGTSKSLGWVSKYKGGRWVAWRQKDGKHTRVGEGATRKEAFLSLAKGLHDEGKIEADGTWVPEGTMQTGKETVNGKEPWDETDWYEYLESPHDHFATAIGARIGPGFDAVVQGNGQEFEPRRLEPDEEEFMGKPKECYTNALYACYGHPGWQYGEGYVRLRDGAIPYPIAHAWAIDEQGKAIDVTLDQDRAINAEYYGVELDPVEVGRAAVERGHGGPVLEWPELGLIGPTLAAMDHPFWEADENNEAVSANPDQGIFAKGGPGISQKEWLSFDLPNEPDDGKRPAGTRLWHITDDPYLARDWDWKVGEQVTPKHGGYIHLTDEASIPNWNETWTGGRRYAVEVEVTEDVQGRMPRIGWKEWRVQGSKTKAIRQVEIGEVPDATTVDVKPLTQDVRYDGSLMTDRAGAQQVNEEQLPDNWKYENGNAIVTGIDEPVPLAPGETEIPEGYIRLYHYTKPPINAEILRTEGLRHDAAIGEQYGEPNLVWASTTKPDPNVKIIAEFAIPWDDPRFEGAIGAPWGRNAEREAMMKWGSESGHDVAFYGSVTPDEIIAVHQPWHEAYRYMHENEGVIDSEILSGNMDWALDDPRYGPAILKIRAESRVAA